MINQQLAIPLVEKNIIPSRNAITIYASGRIAIPKYVYDKVGLSAGDCIEFYFINQETYLRKVEKSVSVLRRIGTRLCINSLSIVYAIQFKMQVSVLPAKLFVRDTEKDEVLLSRDPVINNTPLLYRTNMLNRTAPTSVIITLDGASKTLASWKSRLKQLQKRSKDKSKSPQSRADNETRYVRIFEQLVDLGYRDLIVINNDKNQDNG